MDENINKDLYTAEEPVVAVTEEPAVAAEEPAVAAEEPVVAAEEPAVAPLSQQNYSYYPPENQVSPKSRTVALILSIAVGELGINRFYLGKEGGGKRLTMYIFAIVLDIMAIIPYVGFLFALGSLGLWIPILIGYVKDIIHSAKGTITDGQGLPVTKW